MPSEVEIQTAEPNNGGDHRFLGWFPLAILLLSLCGGLFLIHSLFWLGPENFHEKKEFLSIVTQVITGIAVISGLLLTFASVRISQRNTELTSKTVANATEQLRIDRDTKIADLFYKASEQLGDASEARRIAGLYSLERIAGDFPLYYSQCIDVVCAFIRSRSSVLRRDFGSYGRPTDEDVKVAFQVLARRAHSYADGENNRLQLQGAYLNGVEVTFGDFSFADMTGSILDHSRFVHSSFQLAQLRGSSFKNAELIETNFVESVLAGVNFDGAFLGYHSESWGGILRPLQKEYLKETPQSWRFVKLSDVSSQIPGRGSLFEDIKVPSQSVLDILVEVFGNEDPVVMALLARFAKQK